MEEASAWVGRGRTKGPVSEVKNKYKNNSVRYERNASMCLYKTKQKGGEVDLLKFFAFSFRQRAYVLLHSAQNLAQKESSGGANSGRLCLLLFLMFRVFHAVNKYVRPTRPLF